MPRWILQLGLLQAPRLSLQVVAVPLGLTLQSSSDVQVSRSNGQGVFYASSPGDGLCGEWSEEKRRR